jgi:hypothetical protein
VQERLEILATHRKKALYKLESLLTRSVKLYLNTGDKEKFLTRVELLKNKSEELDSQIKEDLFDLTFDFSEPDPEKVREWTRETGLHSLYEEVLQGVK